MKAKDFIKILEKYPEHEVFLLNRHGEPRPDALFGKLIPIRSDEIHELVYTVRKKANPDKTQYEIAESSGKKKNDIAYYKTYIDDPLICLMLGFTDTAF